MKRELLLLATGFCTSNFGFSQDNNAVALWQQSHPTISIISSERLSVLSDTERSLLGEYVVFTDRVRLEALQSAQQKSSGDTESRSSEKEAQEIKNWIGLHPDVEIVPHSVHSNLAAEKLEYLQERLALLLAGERITVSDIKNYPY